MTIKTFSAVLVLALAFTACNNDTPQQSTAPTDATPAASTESTADFSAPQGGTSDLSATPGVLTATPPPAVTPVTAAPATGGSGKVNPPHGQPGHVCGTPVGAPLDGSAKPAQGAQPAAKSISVPAPTGASGASGANAATVAPGTNPPHGQPGHVCGTPVGSPLPKQ